MVIKLKIHSFQKLDSSDLPEIATKQTNNTTKETQLSKEDESNCSYLPVVATK